MSKEIPIRGYGADSLLFNIYDELRHSHSIIKDIFDNDRYEELPEEVKNAIEGIHSTLYMAEQIVVVEDNKLIKE